MNHLGILKSATAQSNLFRSIVPPKLFCITYLLILVIAVCITDSSNMTRTWKESWWNEASLCRRCPTYKHCVSHWPPCVATTDDHHFTPVIPVLVTPVCVLIITLSTQQCVTAVNYICRLCRGYAARSKLIGIEHLQCLHSSQQDGLLS